MDLKENKEGYLGGLRVWREGMEGRTNLIMLLSHKVKEISFLKKRIFPNNFLFTSPSLASK